MAGKTRPPDDADPAAEGHEAMMFRHGDGNVLAEVLPVLDEAQFARLFGPASAMVFPAPDHPGSKGSPPRRALLPEASRPPAPDLLSLSMEQMRGIEGVLLERLTGRTASCIQRVGAHRLAGRSDAQLRGDAKIYQKPQQRDRSATSIA